MKKLTILLISVFFLTTTAIAQDYIAVTSDDVVEGREMIQVKQSVVTLVDTVLTLSYINTEIAKLTAQGQEITAKIAEWKAIKAKVEIEADKVRLKIPVLLKTP